MKENHMRKMYWLGLVLIFSLMLYGCTSQTATAEITAEPTAEETVATAAATESSAEAAADAATEAPTAVATEVVDCQPYNLLNDIFPSVNSALPAISEDGDHILGPVDAKMVILEYSDFQ